MRSANRARGWFIVQAPDIAFVINASTGLAALLQGLPWQPGDEVLTLDDEFPNQLYVSAVLARFGARLRTVAWSEFYQSVNERTRLVVLSTVNYATGFRPPLEEISRYLRERGVLLYVDGSQSVGALQFDIGLVRPSVLCVDAYKWMLSANGAGFLYVDPELRQRLPATVVGWRSDRDWRSVDALNHGEPVFAQTAEKYEGGMLPFPSIYGMGAVIDLMLQSRAGGDRSARAGTGGEGQSDVVRPGRGSECGRIANRDGNSAGPGLWRIGAVAEGAANPGVGAARQAARFAAFLQRRDGLGDTAEGVGVSAAWRSDRSNSRPVADLEPLAAHLLPLRLALFNFLPQPLRAFAADCIPREAARSIARRPSSRSPRFDSNTPRL